MLNRFWSTQPISTDLGLLLLRIVLAVLMMTHGWSKFLHYTEKASSWPDPLGVSSPVSLLLTIFAELICSCFLLLGLFTRPALIPLIFTMVVVVFVIHGKDDLTTREHALSFLVPYLALYLTGPGRFSVDGLLKR